MNGDLERLQQRIEQLESVEREYNALKQLINAAANNQPLDMYGAKAFLIVDSATQQIIEANAKASALFGFEPYALHGLRIDRLEIDASKKQLDVETYVNNAREEQLYTCDYRHHDGRIMPMRVYRRVMTREDAQTILHYTVEEVSLQRKLWNELHRREDSNFHFREKLKSLNEINLQLTEMKSIDEVCRNGILLGRDKLEFDRLSIWLWDSNAERMIGTYGIDESGAIRDEHGASWSYDGTHVVEFIEGKKDRFVVHDQAPIFNEASQIVGYGWHISVPLMNGRQFMGFMSADNFINHLPLKDYQTELLRLYGITLGHLVARQVEQETIRKHEVDLRLEQARNQMLEAFIRDIGHEFRTPLSVIEIKSYLIKKTDDEIKKGRIVEEIQDQVEAIMTLVDNLAYIVKLQNESEANFAPIDVIGLTKWVTQYVADDIEDKTHQWVLQLDTTSLVMGNAETLKRAIQEIIKNATQFTPANGIITVSSRLEENTVCIQVQDTGSGIPEDEIDKIFNRLYRSNHARTTRGAGLGLSIAKLIIEAHHGTITVKSIPNQGSTFEICLPMIARIQSPSSA